MKIQVGKYEVEDNGFGVNVFQDGYCIASIDGVEPDDLSEEDIEEFLYGDTEEEDLIDWDEDLYVEE